jgi:hypothetical protein
MHKSKVGVGTIMKRTMTIGLLGAILAVAVGFISTNAISATPFLMAASDVSSDESAYMIGHVEYTVRGADGQIKQYVQGDNLIVDRGRDCAAQAIFDPANTGACTNTIDGFQFIAIGNGTHVDDNGQTRLVDTDGTDGCDSDNTTSDVCEMQRSPAVATIVSNAGSTVVTVTNAATPFTFNHGGAHANHNGVNADQIQILESGLFDANPINSATDNMFSARSVTGISVTNADTLAVTWTITLS